MIFHLYLDFKESLNFTAGSIFCYISTDHFHSSQTDFFRKWSTQTGKILAFSELSYSEVHEAVKNLGRLHEVVEKAFLCTEDLHSDPSSAPKGQLCNFKKASLSLQSSIFSLNQQRGWTGVSLYSSLWFIQLTSYQLCVDCGSGNAKLKSWVSGFYFFSLISFRKNCMYGFTLKFPLKFKDF